MIRLNGVVQSVVPIPNNGSGNSNDPAPDVDEETYDPVDAEDDDDDDTEEHGELICQVNKLIDKNDADAEDGPDWMFDDGEKLSKDQNYVFCPAPHRKQILHLFTKHFCQHPLFAEKDGNWTAKKIRENAVYKMYNFCRVRGLSEVWGYMWACWYSPKMWKLWARSSSPYISRLRTTMTVENFWRQLKHSDLHNVHHPRLDHLVWILIKQVTPVYLARGEILNDENRLGRPKGLTSYQTYFKRGWKKLLSTPVSNKEYDTRIDEWTCTCGRQKYDRHHLCKHLVQSVGTPPVAFWSQIYRRRSLPIYRHPDLVKASERESGKSKRPNLDTDGNITDGDDHIWTGDQEILAGGGGWKTQLSEKNISLVLGKRTRQDRDSERTDPHTCKKSRNASTSAGPSVSNAPETPVHIVPHDVIDLTMSSPPREEAEDEGQLTNKITQQSSPLAYGSEGEEEVCLGLNLRNLTLILHTIQ